MIFKSKRQGPNAIISCMLMQYLPCFGPHIEHNSIKTAKIVEKRSFLPFSDNYQWQIYHVIDYTVHHAWPCDLQLHIKKNKKMYSKNDFIPSLKDATFRNSHGILD